MNVLLVDDEKELIATLAERLSFRNIQADWVTNGKDAMQLVRDNKYDIAMLDIKMPGISGFELGAKIKEIDPKIQIIFCTGHGSTAHSKGDTSQFENALSLSKPIDINNLLEKMKQLMNKEV